MRTYVLCCPFNSVDVPTVLADTSLQHLMCHFGHILCLLLCCRFWQLSIEDTAVNRMYVITDATDSRTVADTTLGA